MARTGAAARRKPNMRYTARRTLAKALCVCFIAFILLSSVFIETHVDHIHDHDGPDGTCAQCACVANAVIALKIAGTAIVITVAATAPQRFRASDLPSARSLAAYSSVDCKVRLNN